MPSDVFIAEALVLLGQISFRRSSNRPPKRLIYVFGAKFVYGHVWVTLAWVVREGVTNVVRHSGAGSTRLVVTSSDGTATLELTPQQAEIITVAQQMADRLTLALRPITDTNEKNLDEADYLVSGNGRRGTVRLIKSGEVSEVGARK